MTATIGRFAPTPSGPLHLGSLLTALGSFLAARAGKGRWLLRIDNLDTPRVRAGSESEILRQLEAYGLHWDGQPRRQSEHLDEYADALDRLQRDGMLYACVCTRAQLVRDATAGTDEPVYSGTCRDRGCDGFSAAIRVRVGTGMEEIADRLRGHLICSVERDIGDFVLRRKDGQFAYQLACSVDEAAQGITEVVRGADLIPSTFKQVWLMRQLDLPVPLYTHLPLLVDSEGRKLSKQNRSSAIRPEDAATQLTLTLGLLGQAPPTGSGDGKVEEVLAWAIRHWDPAKVQKGPLKIV